MLYPPGARTPHSKPSFKRRVGEAVDIGAHGSEQTMHVTTSSPHSAGQCPMPVGHSFLAPGVHPLPQTGLRLPLGNHLPPCPTAPSGWRGKSGPAHPGEAGLLILSEGARRPPSPPTGLGTGFPEALHPEWNEMDMRKCWRHSFPHTGLIQGGQLISCCHSEAWPL